MFNKDNIKDIATMTEEERQNPELLKQRKAYKETPIAVYYGSPKEGLTDVCLTCKKRSHCKYNFETKERGMQLRRAADVSEFTEGLTDKEILKIRMNILIIINCMFKEEE